MRSALPFVKFNLRGISGDELSDPSAYFMGTMSLLAFYLNSV